MESIHVTIEDHVVPQLMTSALEAYEIRHPNGRKKEDRLETFGLLWGYVIPARESSRPRIVATVATVETSALRKEGSVEPDFDSLEMKMEFVKKYWPHLEVVGTFHSHPYNSVQEVKDVKGWRASPDDEEFWPDLHQTLFPETPYLVHLIVTVTALSKSGWAFPKEIENNSGFELSMGPRKVWMTSYATEICFEDEEAGHEEVVRMMDFYPELDVPSLTTRVWNGTYR